MAGAIRLQEQFDHDYPTVDFGADEEAVSGAIEGNLNFVLPAYVHLDLNRPFHKDAA